MLIEYGDALNPKVGSGIIPDRLIKADGARTQLKSKELTNLV